MNGWVGMTVWVNGWLWMSALIHSHPFTQTVIRNECVREFIPKPDSCSHGLPWRNWELIGNNSTSRGHLVGQTKRRKKNATSPPLSWVCRSQDLNLCLKISARSHPLDSIPFVQISLSWQSSGPEPMSPDLCEITPSEQSRSPLCHRDTRR